VKTEIVFLSTYPLVSFTLTFYHANYLNIQCETLTRYWWWNVKKESRTWLVGFLFSLVLWCSMIVSCQTCHAAGSTLHVGLGQEYLTIQSAIDAANESDTILVHSGTYNEEIIIDKALTLMGESQGTVYLIGDGDHTIKVTADNVIITQCTIKNNAGSHACIFLLSASNCEISHTTIRLGGNGIYLVSSDENTITENTIKDNNIGLYLSNSRNNIIQSNTIYQNNANGVFLPSTSTGNIFARNDFSENSQSNARDAGSNSWSVEGQGNFWDNYNGYDSNGDGIGDSPYDVPGGHNQDLHPLGYFLSGSPIPVAFIDSITPNPATQGATVQFHGHGTDDGVILQWQWSSNIDGMLSSSEDFSTGSLSIGTHSISFRVKDDDDQWSDYAMKSLSINAPSTDPPGGNPTNQRPTASILSVNPSTLVYGEEVYIHGIGTDADGFIIAYSWSSNIDGELCTDSACTIMGLSAGTHILSFKVQDNSNEWSDEATFTLTVISEDTSTNTAPIALPGESYSGYVNNTLLFDASSSYDPDGDTITSYIWSFGDGTTGSGFKVAHVYTSSGTFPVKLTVTDSQGLSSSASTVAVITPATSTETNQHQTSPDPSGGNWLPIPGFETGIILAVLGLLAFWKVSRKKRKS
jgi:parallel beta-helix repeat protein